MNTITYKCPHCGRTWIAVTKAKNSRTGWTGFLSKSVRVHREICAGLTTQERIAARKKAQANYIRRPPKNTRVMFPPIE